MRSSIGGWVENILETALPSSGDSIQIWATAFDFCCTTVESAASTSSALRSPAGLRVNETAVASASDSRRREIALLSSVAAIGARIKTNSETTNMIGLALLSRSRRPPPNHIMRIRKSLKIAIAPAVVAATAETRVSRLATCAISWAITPCSSSRSITSRMRVVKAISAWSGSRPVANAFGAVSTTIATCGIGSPLAITTSSMTLKSSGLSSRWINFAPVIFKTNLSDP